MKSGSSLWLPNLNGTPHSMQQLSFYTKTFFGILAIGLGLTLLSTRTRILDYVKASVLILKPNSYIKNLWLTPPEDVPTDIYFFNWTNTEDFYDPSIKPKIEQCGPYRYMQHIEKTNVVWNDNNTVTYNRMTYWTFDEKHANGNLSDSITTLNGIAASLAHVVRDWNYFIKKGVSAFLSANSYQIYFTKTVDQFLNGFKDPLLEISRLFPFIVTDIPRLDKFGLIHIKNGSDTFDGTFNVANGINGNFDILNWNYCNVTPNLHSSCAEIRGSTGELYSLQTDYIEIFVPEMCRTVRLDFEKEVVVHGIRGNKYTLGLHALDNGTRVQGNECYCAGDCIPSGLINMSSCLYGLPYYISLPHWYAADHVYLDAFEGLHPEKEKHETYIIVEPKTGILLKAVVRVQMNILLHPVEYISLYEDARKLYFPMVWAEQTIVLPQTERILLKMYLIFSDVIIVTSILLIFTGLYTLVFPTVKSKISVLYTDAVRKKLNELPEPEEEPLQGGTKRKIEIIIREKPPG